ncbi:type IV secretion system DNA-binding domain-containing protein [Nakamurella sp. PAMC28650]|nr:type IV secretion system DNA-binding domain-containing protein [Nakamurella sp. PAMC28650]
MFNYSHLSSYRVERVEDEYYYDFHVPELENYYAEGLFHHNSGKSTLLHNLAAQVMEQEYGLILIEPKGDLSRQVLDSIPKKRVDDVVWFNPLDKDWPIALNILDGPDPEQTAGQVVGLFRTLYGSSWGPRLEMILKYAVLTAALNKLTLYDVKHMLFDSKYRNALAAKSGSVDVKLFWSTYKDDKTSDFDSVMNKLDAFVGLSVIRNITGQPSGDARGLNLREVVNENKILIVPLTREIGETTASMLGSIIMTQLWQEVQSRKTRKPVYFMIDEAQRFMGTATSVEDILSQARSYGMGVILANQNVDQIKPASLLSAFKANTASKIVFKLGYDDALVMARDFKPLDASNLQGLDEHEVAALLLTPTGTAGVATVATSRPPGRTAHGTAAWQASRDKYGRAVADVEVEFEAKFGVKEKVKQSIGHMP